MRGKRKLRRRALESPVVRGADHCLLRHLVLDVGALDLRAVGVPASSGLRWGVEAALEPLVLLIEPQPRAEAPGALEDVRVRVIGLQSELGVGAEREAGLDALRARFHHRHVERRGGRVCAGVDLHARRGKVAAFDQPALEDLQLGAVVGLAALERVHILDDALRVALESRDRSSAGVVLGAALEFDFEPRRAGYRVDACRARGDACRGVAAARKLDECPFLRGVPFALAKRHAGLERPVATHACDLQHALRIGGRASMKDETHVAYHGARARSDADHDARRAAPFDGAVDAGAEVAFGGERFARRAARFRHDALEKRPRDARFRCPAHEVETLLQHGADRHRRVDHDREAHPLRFPRFRSRRFCADVHSVRPCHCRRCGERERKSGEAAVHVVRHRGMNASRWHADTRCRTAGPTPCQTARRRENSERQFFTVAAGRSGESAWRSARFRCGYVRQAHRARPPRRCSPARTCASSHPASRAPRRSSCARSR